VTTPVVRWRHSSYAAGDYPYEDTGIIWVAPSLEEGDRCLFVGGVAEAMRNSGGHNSCAPENVAGNGSDSLIWHATGVCPVVGYEPWWDDSTDTFYINIGFQAPPGASMRVHVWALVEEAP
jgi:hypothetical protein